MISLRITVFFFYHSLFLGNERFFARLKSSRFYDVTLSFPAIVIVIEARDSYEYIETRFLVKSRLDYRDSILTKEKGKKKQTTKKQTKNQRKRNKQTKNIGR